MGLAVGFDVGVAVTTAASSEAGVVDSVVVGAGAGSPHAAIRIANVTKTKVNNSRFLRIAAIVAHSLPANFAVPTIRQRRSTPDRRMLLLASPHTLY